MTVLGGCPQPIRASALRRAGYLSRFTMGRKDCRRVGVNQARTRTRMLACRSGPLPAGANPRTRSVAHNELHGMNSHKRSKHALLLLDLQRDFLDPRGRMPVASAHVEPMLAVIRRAIREAQRNGELVVKIGNEFRRGDVLRNVLRRHAAVQGTPGAAWDPRADAVGAPYIAKWTSSLYARACVAATAKAALKRDLAVEVLAPAVACKSDASRSKALNWLARHGVQLVMDPQTRGASGSWSCD
jgi:nicotinamidase-related amidase